MRLTRPFLRLFLDNLGIVLAALSVAGYFTYQRLDSAYQGSSQHAQERVTSLMASHIASAWPLSPAELDRIVREMAGDDRATRVTVIAADGVVLGDSQAASHTMGNHRTPDRPEVIAALEGRTGVSDRRSDTLGIQYRYVALPVRHGNAVVAAVRVAVPVKTIADGDHVLRNAILAGVLVAVVASVLLAFLSSRRWYSPLYHLTELAKQLASGNLEPRTGVYGTDRLAELARALNEVRDNLGKRLAEIAAQHRDFDAVLRALGEGVLATGQDGIILLANPAADGLLAAPGSTLRGRPLQSVLSATAAIQFHDRLLQSVPGAAVQFELDTPRGRRTLELGGATVRPGPSAIACVLVIRDVTELAAAAAMKTQFVANASHELRTPVATLRAAVDTLRSLGPEEKDDVPPLGDVLDRHVTRLEEMTKDLLDLHTVESPKYPVKRQVIPAGELAEWVRSRFAAQAADKGVILSVDEPPKGFRLASDRKLVELILRNLLDNAIKFTASGGNVRCGWEVNSDGVQLRVSDTGCGITPADQPRVFERFFQSNAARTGSKSRGTGLGLAIVKHAVDRLGGSVSLHSELGVGTTLVVVLPAGEPDPA